MLYLDLAGVYLPFSLHSQTSLLYRTSNEAKPSLYGSTTLYGAIVQDDLSNGSTPAAARIRHMAALLTSRRLRRRSLPGSLAVTKGITVVFFSSAY